MTTSQLENRISVLNEKIENCGCKYRIKSLKSELGFLKAEKKGNFITKADLVEYKSLIIFLMKKGNYRGYMNLKESMTQMLENIENENLVFKTKRGVKGILSKMAISIALCNSEKNLREKNVIDINANSYGNEMLESFTQFRLNTLM